MVGDLRLDLLSKVAWRSGQRIDLAPREWALLELFMRHPNQVLSRAQILGHVWDYSFDTGSNVVDVYVGYLRRKLNQPGLPPMVETVRGAGYRFVRPDPHRSIHDGLRPSSGRPLPSRRPPGGLRHRGPHPTGGYRSLPSPADPG